MNRIYLLTLSGLVSVAGLAGGCTHGEDGDAGDGDFVSDNPYGGDSYGNGEDGGLTGTGGDDGAGEGGDGDGDEGAPGGEGDPEREIAEADIVQVVGDRVYALSRYSGLAVIDAKDPANLKILGRYESEAEPFEMYVDGDQVFVMFTDFGTWQYDALEGYYSWQTDSRLITLDASVPSDIEVTGNYAMPGEIQDSRRVGDVLYLVTYENGYCWGCGDRQRTVVTSLDVADETEPVLVDQLPFVDEKDSYGWQRSVSATNERLYIAGPRWSDDNGDQDGSRIEVVDISDAGGALVKGTSVEVAGQIQSRWQMDEHEDVLRVVSQPGWWWGNGQSPRIETFTVTSSSQITALGSTTMVLPRPESLRSVRFDGDRAYAITFEQTDPLFTIDLADPAVPKQVGELEIPGWVYHMEPRGDQILALGYDNGSDQGNLNVSLFDVSDFANPALLDRVHFGGDWGDFAEDQDRVHKAFTILDDLGLIMVPYEGWTYDEGDDGYECGYSQYHGGVQLIDFDATGLDIRGVAESRGRARRAFMHRDHLFAVSDRSVQTFNINNRDNPLKIDETALATYVQNAVPVGNHVVRVSRDWWSDEYALEVALASDPGNPEPVGRLDIADVLPEHDDCYGWYGYGELVEVGGYAYLISEGYEQTAVTVIDINDPAAPAVVTTEVFDFQRGWGDSWFGGFESHGERIAVAGDSLVLMTTDWRDGSSHDNMRGTFEIIDVSNPRAPKHGTSVPRGKAMAMGALIHTDGALISWHTESANNDGSKVRFYIDRLDVKDPAAAKLKTPVNVPGMPVAYREDLGRAVTVDFQINSKKMSEDQCWSQSGVWNYDYESGRCQFLEHDVYTVDVNNGSASIAKNLDVEKGTNSSLNAAMASDTRVFFEVGGPAETINGWGSEIVSLELTAGKNAKMGRTEQLPGWVRLAEAQDDRALAFTDGHMTIVDATDAEAPASQSFDTGTGYGCWDLAMHGDHAYCAKGQYGLSVFDLP